MKIPCMEVKINLDYKLSKFIINAGHIFTSKKTRFTIYIATVLWLAFATQIIVNLVFKEEIQITHAFVKTNTSKMQSMLEVIAEYDKTFLSEVDKKELINYIANDIGLKVDGDIAINREGQQIEYSYFKQAKSAATTIKVVSIEEEINGTIITNHYVIVRLNISESIQNIDRYKGLIQDSLKAAGLKELQVTMQYEGSHSGRMSEDEMETVAELLVEELQGKTAWKHSEGDMYVVYAYTGLLNEYILSMGSKVNIHIAFTYDEQNDKTLIYLATPIINEGY